jgi:hypothetical protein
MSTSKDGVITQIHNEIAWNGKDYLSLSCLGEFPTLEDMDRFWADYFNELSEDKRLWRW